MKNIFKKMFKKKRLNKNLLMLALFGAALFLLLIFYFTPIFPTQYNSALTIKNVSLISGNSFLAPEPEVISFGLPVRIKIPEINVDSLIESVGLTPEGAMDVPKAQENVAWFNLGTRPGESGSAVMAGHYGIKDGRGSVFDKLYKLRPGDKIIIEDEKGMLSTFVVSGNKRYNPSDNALAVFSSSDGKSHLNLITCESDWDAEAKSYSKRLVIFADKE